MLYLDHAATTPIEEAALARMNEVARERWGNPSSLHSAGRRARASVAEAAAQVAAYLGCEPGELRFASSASQALEWAIERCARAFAGPIASSELEHPAVIEALANAAVGERLAWLARARGLPPEASNAKLSSAKLVVLADLNHELGTRISPSLREATASDCVWIVDAAQSAAWLDPKPWLDERTLLVAASAKLGGPPGVAVIRVPQTLARVLAPEQRLDVLSIARGTLPWLSAVGMGAACAARLQRREHERARVEALARRLLAGLSDLEPNLLINSAPEAWLGPILNVGFPGWKAREVEHELDLRGVAIARGSACQSRQANASKIVAAAYPSSPERAETATRWSLGWTTSEAEVDQVLSRVAMMLTSRGRI